MRVVLREVLFVVDDEEDERVVSWREVDFRAAAASLRAEEVTSCRVSDRLDYIGAKIKRID